MRHRFAGSFGANPASMSPDDQQTSSCLPSHSRKGMAGHPGFRESRAKFDSPRKQFLERRIGSDGLPDEQAECGKDHQDGEHDSEDPVEPSLLWVIDPVRQKTRQQKGLKDDLPEAKHL